MAEDFDRLAIAARAAGEDLLARAHDGKARAQLLTILCEAGEDLAVGGDPFAIAARLAGRLAREVRGAGPRPS